MYHYYSEIKCRVLLLLLCWCSVVLVSYFFKEVLLNIITHISLFDTPSYIFTDVGEVFSVYIHLIFFVANQFLVCHVFYHVLLFILPSVTKLELRFLIFVLSACLFLYLLSFLVFSRFLFSLSWSFFLSFQHFDTLKSFPLDFEAKLVEFSLFYTKFYFISIIYFQTFLIPVLFLKYFQNELQFYASYRKPIYYFCIIFSTLVTPPDVFSQFSLSLGIVFCCEIAVFWFVFQKCLKLKVWS